MSGDTVFALASGGGRAAIAVVRVSGPAAADALTRIGGAPLPEPRRAVARCFRQPDTGEPIDRGLALWFPGPASATGEDVAEFHVHGGPAVLDSLLGALAALPGLRPAEPGAFTRRAFEAGRLDLTQAEGIADLVAAETEAQRRQAFTQMEGGLHRLYDGWRARLMETMAHAEAAIDFSDQDLSDDPLAAAAPRLAALEAEIAAHLDDARRGERLRSGVHHRHRGRAQRRKIQSSQSLGGKRGGHRVYPRRHHPRCRGGAPRPRRLAPHPRRHSGPAREPRRDRERRRAPRARPGGERRSHPGRLRQRPLARGRCRRAWPCWARRRCRC